jgi:hypothetical protein
MEEVSSPMRKCRAQSVRPTPPSVDVPGEGTMAPAAVGVRLASCWAGQGAPSPLVFSIPEIFPPVTSFMARSGSSAVAN